MFSLSSHQNQLTLISSWRCVAPTQPASSHFWKLCFMLEQQHSNEVYGFLCELGANPAVRGDALHQGMTAFQQELGRVCRTRDSSSLAHAWRPVLTAHPAYTGILNDFPAHSGTWSPCPHVSNSNSCAHTPLAEDGEVNLSQQSWNKFWGKWENHLPFFFAFRSRFSEVFNSKIQGRMKRLVGKWAGFNFRGQILM